MSRVINPDNPGKKRNYELRTCAELVRHLSQKTSFDDEARDMLAQIVFSLREINETIEHSAEVWEKRNYWIKAEELRQTWRWVVQLSVQIENLLRKDKWEAFPEVMVALLKNIGDVKVKKFTRTANDWAGAYERLMS
jgi:hypothetical protein